MNPISGLPEVDEDKCTACGACVKACPKSIIELRKKGVKGRRIYVACSSKEKGALARKACSAAFGAISLDTYLAYIDAELCKLCRKCVVECPTGAILEVNFPPRKKEPVTAATPPADRIPASTTVTVPNNSGSDTPAVTPHPNTKPQNPSEPTLF